MLLPVLTSRVNVSYHIEDLFRCNVRMHENENENAFEMHENAVAQVWLFRDGDKPNGNDNHPRHQLHQPHAVPPGTCHPGDRRAARHHQGGVSSGVRPAFVGALYALHMRILRFSLIGSVDLDSRARHASILRITKQ